jgi:galactokinase
MRAFAPGRVNLIGDHTDYTGGLVLPMAIELGTTVEGLAADGVVRLTSANADGEAVIPLDSDDPSTVEPAWARYVAGVVWALRPPRGFVGRVSTTLPMGGGLSSSTALGVAVALALGHRGTAHDLARLCQRAEIASSGVPGGIMDQLCSAAGVDDHALLIDCSTLDIDAIAMPDAVDVVVIDSGESRWLAQSGYAERRAQCDAAIELVGPLGAATIADVARIHDPVLRARARHVVTENQRVRDFAGALRAGDASACGALMLDSHRSLREDFEVSTPVLDAIVERLTGTPGVHGARLTGAGFGGCVVALTEPGALTEGTRVRAAGGARVLEEP